jgi:hypothetical protein
MYPTRSVAIIKAAVRREGLRLARGEPEHAVRKLTALPLPEHIVRKRAAHARYALLLQCGRSSDGIAIAANPGS